MYHLENFFENKQSMGSVASAAAAAVESFLETIKDKGELNTLLGPTMDLLDAQQIASARLIIMECLHAVAQQHSVGPLQSASVQEDSPLQELEDVAWQSDPSERLYRVLLQCRFGDIEL